MDSDFRKHARKASFIPVLFDVKQPKGLVLHWRALKRSDKQDLYLASKEAGELNEAKFSDGLAQNSVIGWERMTPEVLQHLAPHQFSDAEVEAMKAELASAGKAEYPFDQSKFDWLLEEAPALSARISELSGDANKVFEAERAYRKNACSAGSSTGAPAAN